MLVLVHCLAICQNAWYYVYGTAGTTAGAPLDREALFAPLMKGGMTMVTYDELFQYTLVLIAVIGLVVTVIKKK